MSKQKINSSGNISPMLATLTKTPFNNSEWLYEVKWDGYRIIAHVNKKSVRLDSRGGLDYTNKYPPVVEALQRMKINCILDGEIVVLNDQGLPDFDGLQKYRPGQHLVYYVFDILFHNGNELMHLPLTKRKDQLSKILKNNDVTRYSDHFDNGLQLYDHMKELGMEGIVAKLRDSLYTPGIRSKNWLKIPTEKRQEFVIGGWVDSDKSGRSFKTLLFGAYNDGKLEWIGHGGGGFKAFEMPDIKKKLQGLKIKKSPFVNEVEYDGVAHWVKPQLVANFKYATFTKSGKIRKPAIFLGFRNDKKPTEVVREIAKDKDNGKRVTAKQLTKKAPKKLPASADSNWPEVERQKITSHEKFEFDDCAIDLTNVEREIWDGVTKADLIQYYHSIAEYILPHIKDRPQSLHLKLGNAGAPGLYIKDMEGRQPECAEIFSTPRKHKKKGKRDVIDYLVCNNEATLLWMINLGCIDVNPWSARTSSPLRPDWVSIDLDPSDGDFKKAIEAVKVAKQVLNKYKLKAFAKTSGKTGIHVYIPCAGFNFPQARSISERLCGEIHDLIPELTTTEVSISKRGDKLYLDPNQNDEADTLAAPYSVRPFHIPTISTPLEWKEIDNKLDPAAFTVYTIQKRIERKGDLFGGVLYEKNAKYNANILQSFL